VPKDTLDIIDTAVKIGLGALISGFSTYFVTSKNHSAEKSKKLIEKRIQILEFSTENIEPYFYALRNYASKLDGSLKHGLPPGKTTSKVLTEHKLRERDAAVIEYREKKAVAISRLKLIGEEKVTNKLKEVSELENEFRQILIFEKTIMTPEELNDWRQRLKHSIDDYYEALQVAFESTYS